MGPRGAREPERDPPRELPDEVGAADEVGDLPGVEDGAGGAVEDLDALGAATDVVVDHVRDDPDRAVAEDFQKSRKGAVKVTVARIEETLAGSPAFTRVEPCFYVVRKGTAYVYIHVLPWDKG